MTTLLWLRRDLRLSDHPALTAAIARGQPVIPVFILDPVTESWGAAARWRLAQSLRDLAPRIADKGGRLILRRGDALKTLQALAQETGATGVIWSRLYDPESVARDTQVKSALRDAGLEARSVNGSLLHEPWEIATQTGGFYKVYTPFSKAAWARDVGDPLPEPAVLPAPGAHPASDDLEAWRLEADMNRGAAVLASHARIGEQAAQEMLDAFLARRITGYKAERDRFDVDACSGLSPFLATGEISPRTIWHAGRAALERAGGKGPEHFLKELLWREFAYHLLHHTPELASRNWREGWDAFPWREDNEDAERWRRGATGEPMIDAAMREMYVTGVMHNRGRMLVASYLTKHLMTDWRVGEAWFRDCLIDWDPASNALGWQWTAGCGPDAAPFFRIFNPATQAEKFDPDGLYRRRWLAEGQDAPPQSALDFFAACPRSWAAEPGRTPPAPMIDLKRGRERALAAYQETVSGKAPPLRRPD